MDSLIFTADAQSRWQPDVFRQMHDVRLENTRWSRHRHIHFYCNKAKKVFVIFYLKGANFLFFIRIKAIR